MPIPDDLNPSLISTSEEKQAAGAIKAETIIVHIHNGDLVFWSNNKTYRIHDIEEMIVAERTYSSTTTNSPGAATAQGDGAKASGSAEKTNLGSPIDFNNLATELALLRAEMRRRADGSIAQDKAVAAIAEAEDSAVAKDEIALSGHIVKAGAWALNVAKDLGVAVAAEYMKGLLSGT